MEDCNQETLDAQANLLLRSAFDKAKSSGSLDDIEKASRVAQAVATGENIHSEARSQVRKMRLEFFQSFSSMLIPLVSLAALFGTILMQAQQLSLARDQNNAQLVEHSREEVGGQWNDFLKSLHGAKDFFNDPSFVPRLQFFINDNAYKAQAIGVAKHVLGRISEPVYFNDLFRQAFSTINRANLPDAIDVLRLLVRTTDTTRSECEQLTAKVDPTSPANYEGLCSTSYFTDQTVKDKVKGVPDGERIRELRVSLSNLYGEQNSTSAAIANYLRTVFERRNDKVAEPVPLDLRSAYFSVANLSGVDFTAFQLDNAVFDTVDLTDTQITPNAHWNWPDVRGSNWWRARSIDKGDLLIMIQKFYPYYPGESYLFSPITKADYETAVRRLCRPFANVCPNTLPYGNPKSLPSAR